jgi:hypothetical protein
MILLNIFFVIKVHITFKKEFRNEEEFVRKLTNKLKLYPVVQVVSFLPATVNRLYNLVSNKENFYLLMIQGIFDAITGLMFAFVFGFNNQVRKSLWDCIIRICCKKGPENTQINQINNTLARTSNISYLDDTILTDN